ncbi:hypothetical protein D3C87_1888970 [compost metagenome]
MSGDQFVQLAGGKRRVLPGFFARPAKRLQVCSSRSQPDHAAAEFRGNPCGRFNACRPGRIFAEVDEDGSEVHDVIPVWQT